MLIICPNCFGETEGRHNLCGLCGEEIKESKNEEIDLDRFEDDTEEDYEFDFEKGSD